MIRISQDREYFCLDTEGAAQVRQGLSQVFFTDSDAQAQANALASTIDNHLSSLDASEDVEGSPCPRLAIWTEAAPFAIIAVQSQLRGSLPPFSGHNIRRGTTVMVRVARAERNIARLSRLIGQ